MSWGYNSHFKCPLGLIVQRTSNFIGENYTLCLSWFLCKLVKITPFIFSSSNIKIPAEWKWNWTDLPISNKLSANRLPEWKLINPMNERISCTLFLVIGSVFKDLKWSTCPVSQDLFIDWECLQFLNMYELMTEFNQETIFGVLPGNFFWQTQFEGLKTENFVNWYTAHQILLSHMFLC